MKYRLTIEQFEPNPQYAEQVKDYEARRQYGQMSGGDYPQHERSIKVLAVEVTDVEFAAIKKAALATMA